MMNEKEKIDLITRISLDINEVKDIDLLLERILTNVRLFFNADAGSIYIREGSSLKFINSQNNTLQRRLGPGRKLPCSTFSIPIDNSSIAGYVANNRRTVSIFDAYDLPVSLPYSFDCKIDGINEYRTQSMLTVPICNQRENVLGVMQIINAMDDDGNIIPFSDSDEPLIKHFATSAGLAMERAQTTRNILLRMVSMAEMRDPRETGSHVNRVAAYSMEIYEEWAGKKGIPLEKIEREKDLLRMAAMLHDVGKVAISDLILKKPSRLTLAEFEIMKAHTYLGARLFRDLQSDFDEVALEVALNHHEKWDGTGYPGLKIPIEELSSGDLFKKNIVGVPKKGEEIPLFGRIVAVADVFDALGSRRVYKQPWSEERVLEEMYKSSGSHFDPEIVAAFFSCHETLKTIAERYPDID